MRQCGLCSGTCSPELMSVPCLIHAQGSRNRLALVRIPSQVGGVSGKEREETERNPLKFHEPPLALISKIMWVSRMSCQREASDAHGPTNLRTRTGYQEAS